LVYLCDVNFLVAMVYNRHTHHLAAMRHMEIFGDISKFRVVRTAQLGMLRILTNAASMDVNVRTSKQAWNDVDALLADERFVFQNEPQGAEVVFRRLTSERGFTPKLWPDAWLAAIAIQSGLTMLSFDRDFLRFKGLETCIL